MHDRRWYAAFFLLFLSLLPFPSVAEDGTGVPILLYHRVGDDRHPSTNVTVSAFREQMAWLEGQGFHVVSTRQLEDHLLATVPLPSKPVVIHFDDGYRSVYENAFPILKEFAFPFTVFMQASALKGGYGDYLTADMIDEMTRAGGSFGAHGDRHVRLGVSETGVTEAEYGRLVAREIGGGGVGWSDRGVAVRWVAYPYGEYNQLVLAAAREAGYRLGFSQDPGTASTASDPFRIPRYAVVGDLSSMQVFRERLTYLPLSVNIKAPQPGPVSVDFNGELELVLSQPELYVPGTLNLFVSELGRVDARIDWRTGVLHARIPVPLRRRLNRVLVSVRVKGQGRYALTSWLLLTPSGGA